MGKPRMPALNYRHHPRNGR